jgi:Flp pilus assembly protein TadG
MENRRMKTGWTRTSDQSGAISIVVAAGLIAFCGFLALAVDVGHLALVKGELQRTADAGSLSGAAGLAPYIGQDPNWGNGQTAATTMVNNDYNKADNQQPVSAITYGFWLLNPQGVAQTLPLSRPAATYMPAPAIKVTVSRNVELFFAPVIGISSPTTVSATAIAVIPEAISIAPSGTFTMAVEESIVYIPSTNTVNLSPQDFGWKDQGQWFNTDGSNDVPTIRKGSSTKAGDNIWIAPGAMATLYQDITPNQTIIVPVVASTDQKTWQNIKGFAAFYITSVDSKSITGHFVANYLSPDVRPSSSAPGLYYNVTGTPKLVSQ